MAVQYLIQSISFRPTIIYKKSNWIVIQFLMDVKLKPGMWVQIVDYGSESTEMIESGLEWNPGTLD